MRQDRAPHMPLPLRPASPRTGPGLEYTLSFSLGFVSTTIALPWLLSPLLSLRLFRWTSWIVYRRDHYRTEVCQVIGFSRLHALYYLHLQAGD